MADKVKHWREGYDWYFRDINNVSFFSKREPKPWELIGKWLVFGDIRNILPGLGLVEIDPSTPWQESKQRRPD